MRQFALLITALLLCSAGAADAQHGFWQPDDRILITSFLNARGIATDQQHVFVATDLGLEIYDATFRRWLPPSTIEDGYPVPWRPVSLAYDARERGVWLLTESQRLFVWSSLTQRWDERFASDVPPAVRRQLLNPDEFGEVMGILPMTDAGDAFGRRFRVAALARGDRSGTFWAATLGANFTFIDTRSLRNEPHVFGTLAPGVRAIAVAPDGALYFGEDQRSARFGITRADTTLQRWQHFEAGLHEVPHRTIHDMLATGDAVYAGAADGLFVLRGDSWDRILDADVRALAAFGGRTWVGTRGLLGWLDEADAFQRSDLPLQTVYDLAARNDTLWIAAEQGLLTLSGTTSAMQLSRTAYGVAASTEAVAVLLADGVHFWQGSGWDGPLRNTSVQTIGRLVSVNAAEHYIWVTGELGVAEWNGRTQTWRHLQVPADIPVGPVYSVAYENGRVWLATPAGALRMVWP